MSILNQAVCSTSKILGVVTPKGVKTVKLKLSATMTVLMTFVMTAMVGVGRVLGRIEIFSSSNVETTKWKMCQLIWLYHFRLYVSLL